METNIQSTLIRHQIGSDEQQAVDARALHAFLENGDKFTSWFGDRVKQYGFIEGVDYVGFSESSEKPFGGRPSKEYAVTTDMAKELCMVERNAKGKEARLYYINLEKEAKALVSGVPKTYTEALRLAADLNERTEKQAEIIKALEPKATFHDRVAEQVDCQNVNEVAKVLGTGERRLWEWLKAQKLVFKNGRCWAAYQEYIDRGYFKVIQRVWSNGNGQEHASVRTLVTGKGLIWIQKKWDERGSSPAPI